LSMNLVDIDLSNPEKKIDLELQHRRICELFFGQKGFQ
jgi:hypothetical protein